MAAHPFHAGERAVQTRAGVRDLAERVGRSIRPTLPPPAQGFLTELRWVIAGGLDARDRPWASLVAGPRGFAHPIDDRTLRLAAVLAAGDPLGEALAPGALVGLLAIDLATRRRLRLNGRIATHDASGLVIAADQVFSNCPKHIQRREDATGDASPTVGYASRATDLSDRQRAWLRAADTFFIATGVPGEGVDVSHRGGMPGFVHVDGNRIVWPDYAGNAMFNTLGNLVLYPHAGLLVPDFETGDALLVSGRAAIDWEVAHAAPIAGAERLITLDVDEVIEIAGAFPARLRLREYSPANPR
jgi:uncharacterized protein